MWYYEGVIYQIYPFGFCGAPRQNDGKLMPRILKVLDFADHLKALNVSAVYFCPVFESSAHGYDTADYTKLDVRLGSNADFKAVCDKLHENGIRVILDGVFNHVGRDFFAFRDVREKKWDSPYKDWFYLSFDGNSCYNDGFWYEGWEGHFELVKLNLDHPDVKNYLFDCVRMWIRAFGIDGLRLDVAYMLNRQFMRELRSVCDKEKQEFFLAGEMIHGNYAEIVNHETLHSATNYECFKGIYSSLNSMNMFEIAHSLRNRFGSEDWCMYRGMHLISFVDNHDVTRIASNLTNPAHLPLAYGILMGMPGIPCIYYGSEWGMEGQKEHGDDALRPAVDAPQWTALTDFIARAAKAHRESRALTYGDFNVLHLTNKQLIFERCADGERVLVMVNADGEGHTAHYNANAGCGIDLLTGKHFDFGAGSYLEPYSVKYIKVQ
ncbi:MAG: alpha-glucosidase C-terminal domain-containing protein [Clostridia bacterium]|nr:alpha-glucosidase C-terminal domain-containing protein [Clostridia bacterium]